MFTKESLDQLDAAGAALVKVAEGMADGVSASDITGILMAVPLAQAVIDEVKADKAKAVARMLGAALSAYGAS